MTTMLTDPAFALFALPDEHQELRSIIRSLADKEIAPFAAEVDENARFPREAMDVLDVSGFNALHVPEEYGGQGADSVAVCIVIEEIARVDVCASMIPGVNKLGTMGLILAGSEELKKQVLPSLASGEALASYALSEREAGSDAAAMRTRAKADGDDWIINSTKSWISNGGMSTWYTVMAVTDPGKGANGISAFMVHKDDAGFSVGPKEKKLGIKEAQPPSCTSRTAGSPGTGSSVSRVAGSKPRWRPWTTRDRRSAHKPWVSPRGAGRRDRIHQGAQAVRPGNQRLPERAIHARRYGYEDRSGSVDGLQRGSTSRAW